MLPTQLVRLLLTKYQAQRARRLYNNWLRQQEDASHARMLEQATMMQNRVPARRPQGYATTAFHPIHHVAPLPKHPTHLEINSYRQAA